MTDNAAAAGVGAVGILAKLGLPRIASIAGELRHVIVVLRRIVGLGGAVRDNVPMTGSGTDRRTQQIQAADEEDDKSDPAAASVRSCRLKHYCRALFLRPCIK